MKRLNVRQQDHLNRKFAALCSAFLEQERKKNVNENEKIKPITTAATVSIKPNYYGGYEIIETKISALPPAYKAIEARYKAYKALINKVHELQTQFRERILFSSNDLDEVMPILEAFAKRIGK